MQGRNIKKNTHTKKPGRLRLPKLVSGRAGWDLYLGIFDSKALSTELLITLNVRVPKS